MNRFLVGVSFLAILAAGAAGAYGYAVWQQRHLALDNNCAHYDMKTGDFTWGSAGIYLTGGSEAEDAAQEVAAHASTPLPPKPQHKPAAPHKQAGGK